MLNRERTVDVLASVLGELHPNLNVSEIVERVIEHHNEETLALMREANRWETAARMAVTGTMVGKHCLSSQRVLPLSFVSEVKESLETL